MNRFIEGLQSLWSNFAKILMVTATTLLPMQNIAYAQVASPPTVSIATAQSATARPALRPTVYTDGDEVSAREFFGFREYIRGIPTTQTNYDLLKQYGCFIGPQAFAAKITARFIEKGEMCQKSMFDKLDGLNKEGTPLTIVFVEGGTATVVKSVKGINVGQNYLEISTYSLAANSDGKPLTVTYNYHANGGQYMAQMLSSLPGTILGATLPALTMAAVSGCNGDCQRGIINVVSAGAQSSSLAGLESNTTVTNSNGGPGGCGTAACGTTTTTSAHKRD
ncbi:MAG: hypothetical protein RLZZ480_778 [Candidatus Parcubacteria bacterium]|jgi:hypothetical protein